MRVWPAPLAFSHVTLARSRPLTCVSFFAFFSTDFRVKVRLLAVCLPTILQIFSFYFIKRCQYLISALTRCGHERVLLWCHAVKLTSFCGMAVNPVRILVPRLKQLPRKCKRGILMVIFSNLTAIDVNFFQTANVPGKKYNYVEKTVFYCASVEITN